jgi:hypothetical protein
MPNKNKQENKCRAGIYTINMVKVGHGGLMCFGGFGQPACKYLKECLEECRGIISDRKIDNLIKKVNLTQNNEPKQQQK